MGNNIRKFFLGNSVGSGIAGWTLPGEWGRTDLLRQYTRYVYSVVSAIAEESAKVTFEAGKIGEDGVFLPVATHPFLDLMKRPNSYTSQFQFLELHFTFIKLSGESFWYMPRGEKSNQPKEVYLLRPDLMEVAINTKDPRGTVEGYVLNKLDGTKQTFKADEIVHFKMPNPLNPYRGLGTVEASKVYIQTEEYSSVWTKNSIFNSGRPSGILNIKGVIDKDAFEALKRQFKDQYSGTKNAGKTMMLKGADGIDYQKLGMDIGEIALKELKDMTRDDIMMMFRVSKTMLGITDDVNRANADASRAVFTENIIKPELDRLLDHINAFVIPMFGKSDVVIEYDDPSMVSDTDKLAEWTAGHNKWLTTNDIREERGLEPLEGGDIIYQSVALSPMGEDATSDTTPAKGLKKKDDRRIVGEVFRQTLYRNQVRWEIKYKGVIKREFLKQKREILGNNKGFKVKAFEEWLFDVKASKGRLISTLFPLGLQMMKDQSKFALEVANDDETVFQLNQRVKDYINERVQKLADSTNDYTVKRIESEIAEGLVKGESITKLRERITKVYDVATKSRAERIARTETIAVSNGAAEEAYRQSPMVSAKEWAANPDACEFCNELDGTVVGIESTFVGLGGSVETEDGSLPINYMDIDTPPLHPNCRCTILPVARE